MARLLLLLFPLLLLYACGQSGDLYLPGNAPERSNPLEEAERAADNGDNSEDKQAGRDDKRDGNDDEDDGGR